MAQQWHKVVVDGVARYRASASKKYVSYNVAKDSWSSKMQLGNIPVEQLAKAPKSIKVRGEAWGVKIERSYLEGERPVVAVIATRGIGRRFNWEKAQALGKDWAAAQNDERCFDPANPDHVWVEHYTHRSMERAQESAQYALERIAKGDSECNAVMVVELR